MPAMTLDELTAALKTDAYTPRSDEDMQAEAERRYASTKNMNRLNAQQAFDATDLALTSQLGRLNSSYDQQYLKAQQQLRQSASQLDRYSLQRGMQRSSYNAQAQANLSAEYGRTLNEIEQNRTDAVGNIEAQRAQAAKQLADQLAQYDADYAADVQAYLDELRDRDFERAQAAQQYGNQIQMQLYEYGLKDPREAGSGSGGGGGGGGSSSSADASLSADTGDTNPGSTYDKLLGSLRAGTGILKDVTGPSKVTGTANRALSTNNQLRTGSSIGSQPIGTALSTNPMQFQNSGSRPGLLQQAAQKTRSVVSRAKQSSTTKK